MYLNQTALNARIATGLYYVGNQHEDDCVQSRDIDSYNIYLNRVVSDHRVATLLHPVYDQREDDCM